jgi:hypothetical protein
VQIEMKYCGVCHSDLHFANNDLGSAVYPMVPGAFLPTLLDQLSTTQARGRDRALDQHITLRRCACTHHRRPRARRRRGRSRKARDQVQGWRPRWRWLLCGQVRAHEYCPCVSWILVSRTTSTARALRAHSGSRPRAFAHRTARAHAAVSSASTASPARSSIASRRPPSRTARTTRTAARTRARALSRARHTAVMRLRYVAALAIGLLAAASLPDARADTLPTVWLAYLAQMVIHERFAINIPKSYPLEKVRQQPRAETGSTSPSSCFPPLFPFVALFACLLLRACLPDCLTA